MAADFVWNVCAAIRTVTSCLFGIQSFVTNSIQQTLVLTKKVIISGNWITVHYVPLRSEVPILNHYRYRPKIMDSLKKKSRCTGFVKPHRVTYFLGETNNTFRCTVIFLFLISIWIKISETNKRKAKASALLNVKRKYHFFSLSLYEAS